MRFIQLLAALIFAGAVHAQGYPNRPIKVIVPYAPGGLPDTIARLVGAKIAGPLGQTLVVENLGGAGAISGVSEVVKAQPDGYTVLVADVGQIAINPHLFAKLPYAPMKDLAPVSLIGVAPLFLVAHPSVPASSVKELVALVHVPYKGTGQSVPALLRGQVSLLYSAGPSIAGHVKEGRVKLLAVSTVRRSPQAPEVPAIAELGLPGYDFPAEIGMLAATGTSREIVNRLSAEIAKAVKQPDVVQRFAQLGIDPVGSTPDGYAQVNKADYEKYEKIVKATEARID